MINSIIEELKELRTQGYPKTTVYAVLKAKYKNYDINAIRVYVDAKDLEAQGHDESEIDSILKEKYGNINVSKLKKRIHEQTEKELSVSLEKGISEKEGKLYFWQSDTSQKEIQRNRGLPLQGPFSEDQIQMNFFELLINEYGYSRRNVQREFKIRMGSSYKRPDIVVFYDGTRHSQENVYIVIEVKKHNSYSSDRQAFEQLYSYMSSCGSCKYGVLVLGNKLSVYKWRLFENGRKVLENHEGIPKNYDEDDLITENVVDIKYINNTAGSNHLKFTHGYFIGVYLYTVLFLLGIFVIGDWFSILIVIIAIIHLTFRALGKDEPKKMK